MQAFYAFPPLIKNQRFPCEGITMNKKIYLISFSLLLSASSFDLTGQTVQHNKPQNLQHSQSYFSKIKEILQDHATLSFIKTYLTIRYQDLTNDLDTFESTERYIAQMLDSLQKYGPGKTRKLFFEPDAIKNAHKKIYTRHTALKYDFDATALLPLIKELESNASILDVGAGFNNFLPQVKKLAGRTDLNYYATAPFVNGTSKDGVIFLHQPGPYTLPAGSYDVIILRAALHHVEDVEKMIEQIRKKLKPSGKLVLIEDSFDDLNTSIWSETEHMSNELLNTQFNHLTDEQKINFLIFNDWYANHLYHAWNTMPLPFYHKSHSGWTNKLSQLGMRFLSSLNMGFPTNQYAMHQPSTLIMVFQQIS